MRNLRLMAVLSVIFVFVVGLSAPNKVSAAVEVTPMAYDFGTVEVGETSSTIITIKNIFVVQHEIISVFAVQMSSDSDSDFEIAVNPAPVSLQPGEQPGEDGDSAEIEVTFTPSNVAPKTATLQIVTNDALQPLVEVALEGIGGETIIEVTPLEYDFGTVTIGDSATTIVTIQNTNGHIITINGISLAGGIDPHFSITSSPTLPAFLDWNGISSAEVEITFSPQTAGDKTTVLAIVSDDLVNPMILVPLSGEGVDSEPDPEEQVAEILDFIDESVAAGTLEGSGNGNSAENRLNALRNMIEAAGDLIEAGDIDGACGQLMAVYKKCDGLPRPPDFVAGEAQEELAQMILDLMASLGC